MTNVIKQSPTSPICSHVTVTAVKEHARLKTHFQDKFKTRKGGKSRKLDSNCHLEDYLIKIYSKQSFTNKVNMYVIKLILTLSKEKPRNRIIQTNSVHSRAPAFIAI